MPTSTDDPFDLARFLDAQEHHYERALDELRAGRKRSHWMWYVFPQLRGLGRSAMAERYAIRSSDEAGAYLAHPILGARLIECCETILSLDGRTANDVFGSPDDLKLRSCATLFAAVSPADSVYSRVLDKYFGGQGDEVTARLIGG